MDFSGIHHLLFGETQVAVLSYRDFDTTEQSVQLSDKSLERLSQISHPIKQREFIASRRLLKEVLKQDGIDYDQVGAPYIAGIQKHISLSHTTNMVGFAQADFRIGFDLEPISNRAVKLHKKFLSEKEQKILDCSSDLEMTKAWSAKEALFKMAQRKKVIFAEDLDLHPINDDNWIGTIYSPNETVKVSLHFSTSDNNILTINPHAPKILPAQ